MIKITLLIHTSSFSLPQKSLDAIPLQQIFSSNSSETISFASTLRLGFEQFLLILLGQRKTIDCPLQLHLQIRFLFCFSETLSSPATNMVSPPALFQQFQDYQSTYISPSSLNLRGSWSHHSPDIKKIASYFFFICYIYFIEVSLIPVWLKKYSSPIFAWFNLTLYRKILKFHQFYVHYSCLNIGPNSWMHSPKYRYSWV